MKRGMTIAASVVAVIIAICGVVTWMFSTQYNLKGVSHFLVVTVDKNQTNEYIGKLDGYKVYVEGLNISGTNFRTFDAKNLSIKKAIENKLVSVNDWKKHALRIRKDGTTEILQYDNYQIVFIDDECVIRPLIR